jgi:branched-chain amino acid transport system substrate-binding protein
MNKTMLAVVGGSQCRFGMTKPLVALVAVASFGMTGIASAEPVKIAVIETLSGSSSLTGKLMLNAVKFGLTKLADEKVWPDGIQLLEYDNQGGPSEAADKLKTAINDGAQIIVQGASSAIAGQITSDVQKYNARNPGKEVLYMNIGGAAMEFTGAKCHFYHFRWETNGDSRFRSLMTAAKKTGALGKKVYFIGQNYSWGQEFQRLTRENAKQYDYTIVGDVLHDVNKIQDFSPYVAKIMQAAPDTVVTGNWGNDLLLLLKAAADAGYKGRFLTTALDQPGNVATVGDAGLRDFTVQTYFPDSNGDKSASFAEYFKSKTGAYPINVQAGVVHAVWGLGESLKALKGKPGDKVSAERVALAMEKVTVDTSQGPITMRREDHQAILPVAVAILAKDAKFKFDNTDKGFKTVLLLSGPQASGPVQESCKMERPQN